MGDFDRTVYDSEIETLSSFYELQDKKGNNLISIFKSHVVSINSINLANVNLYAEYFLSCLGPLLNPKKPVIQLCNSVWQIRNKTEESKSKYNELFSKYANSFNMLNSSKNYNSIESFIGKGILFFPDYLYFFNKIKTIELKYSSVAPLVDEFIESMSETIRLYNQHQPGLLTRVIPNR